MRIIIRIIAKFILKVQKEIDHIKAEEVLNCARKYPHQAIMTVSPRTWIELMQYDEYENIVKTGHPKILGKINNTEIMVD